MSETLILAATFAGVLILSTVVIGGMMSRREVASRVTDAANDGETATYFTAPIVEGASDRQAVFIKHYFSVIRKDKNPNSLSNRLLRAGFFSPNAGIIFQVVRACVSLLAASCVYLVFDLYLLGVSRQLAVGISLLVGALVFFMAAVALERMGVAKEKAFRRLFPDFMDTLIVCVDAGLSIEAAADKVAHEFMETSPDFGLHLSMMMLEVRGGRRLRDALANLAARLRIEEAKSLAVLFRQSEELGTSVTKSLRVYSKEMRQMRILRAEEKANSLPIKMLFPLATFLFPISLIIVLVPIMMRVFSLLQGMGTH